MKKSTVHSSEFDPYYGRYIGKVSENTELRSGFKIGKKEVMRFFNAIPEKQLTYRYQPEKWNIKEILQHLIDAERVFIYRCFRIARRDTTPLGNFDQNIYVDPSKTNEKSMRSLLSEYEINRDNSICLLDSLSDQDLGFIGIVNDKNMSARAAAFSILGHDIWHMEGIKKHYL